MFLKRTAEQQDDFFPPAKKLKMTMLATIPLIKIFPYLLITDLSSCYCTSKEWHKQVISLMEKETTLQEGLYYNVHMELFIFIFVGAIIDSSCACHFTHYHIACAIFGIGQHCQKEAKLF